MNGFIISILADYWTPSDKKRRSDQQEVPGESTPKRMLYLVSVRMLEEVAEECGKLHGRGM